MMKHDEIRQILHESEFKFKDGRTALSMTDEEVEAFLVEFVSSMTQLGRQMEKILHNFSVAISQAIEPLRDLEVILETHPEKS